MSGPDHKVREDFDRIARLTAHEGDGLAIYERFLLSRIPPAAREVLDVGCGTGAFSRALAARGHRVTALDLSPEMIRVARTRPSPAHDVTYVCGDLFAVGLEAEAYDCVVSIATLHHLDLRRATARMVSLLRPGGSLVIHDIRSDAGALDRARSAAALAARAWARLSAGRLREPAAVRAAWREHGRGERYLTMPEVEAWCRAHLPGARVARHLQWRYTVVWRKPDAAERPHAPDAAVPGEH